MAKTSNSSSREFLAQRRKAIAEMAKKRRQQQLVRASRMSVSDSSAKATSVSLPRVTPPTNQS